MAAEDARRSGADADGDRSELLAAAGRVRHPGLVLGYFVTAPDDLPDDDDVEDEDRVPGELREDARLRRAALLVAALEVVDRCIDDLQVVTFGDDGQPDPDEAEESFVYGWFPQRHRGAYDESFFRKVMVTAVQVAADLADPEGGPAACTAEEIIRHAAGVMAGELCDQAGLGRPWSDPDAYLLEDTDFEYLYSKTMDGLENDPAQQAALGVDVMPVQDRFTPFNDTRIVHPYAETSPGPELLHDLLQRLSGKASGADILESGAIDDPAPVTSLAASSATVALVRSAGVADRGLWVPDDSDRERSFAALAAASSSERGSGWLHWEPYDGADTVRAEPVIELIPHRHFPVGEDEPWV